MRGGAQGAFKKGEPIVEMIDKHIFYLGYLLPRHPDRPFFTRACEIPSDATIACLERKKNSHRGIGEKRQLRELDAGAVNQAFLEEIGKLIELEYLELSWPVTAPELSPLRNLRKLRTLIIDSPRAITDFTPILDLPMLDRLIIKNAKHMSDLEWLRPLKDRLFVLGVEGSMWKPQRLPGLRPLEGFAIEALFMGNTIIEDQDLSPVATMPNIRLFHTGLNAPRDEFIALESKKPELECNWFGDDKWGDYFRDPKPITKAN